MITQENIAYGADEIKSMVKTCEKYNKARDIAKKIYNSEFKPDEAAVLSKYLPMLFPEIKEDKDERIRKVIYGWIYSCPSEFFDNGFSKEEMLDWVENKDKQQSTDNKEKLNLLKFIRKETCCGLAEANNALLKLIKVLKERPILIIDKPHKLKIEWEEVTNES